MTPPVRFTWRHQYDEVADEIERLNTDIQCEPETKTVRSFQDDVDLNVMMKRFGVTDRDTIPVVPIDPNANDFTDVPDLRTALDRVRDAHETFNSLPAALRSKFANSPALLWEWVRDPNNVDEAVRLGLLKKYEQPKVEAEPLPDTTK